jgi:putative DNA modification/repair radical SAM protein
MDVGSKLQILADSAKYDVSCASSGAKRSGRDGALGSNSGYGICHSYTPDGRCVSLLKILLTNYCIYDCVFCVNRISSDVPRARFTPHEVVQLTLDFYRRNYIEGLFLSSGIIQSPDYTMEQLIAVARSLRSEHGFNGYIHLKTIPGASELLLADAGRWADRLSANIELPTAKDLATLAPEKNSATIQHTMSSVHERIEEAEEAHSPKRLSYAPAGQSTQMVIGATATTDATILTTASQLYCDYKLKRIYYSAYSPIQHADPRLPVQAPPLIREHRLYQADWLLRFYEFSAADLTTAAEPNLNLSQDPKLVWALRNRWYFPVDVNTAMREQLLRVPGMGYRNVQRILSIRRYHRLTMSDLQKLKIITRRARPFVITGDSRPTGKDVDGVELAAGLVVPQQMQLFEANTTAITGEL